MTLSKKEEAGHSSCVFERNRGFTRPRVEKRPFAEATLVDKEQLLRYEQNQYTARSILRALKGA